jgi:hypothetical protein
MSCFALDICIDRPHGLSMLLESYGSILVGVLE